MTSFSAISKRNCNIMPTEVNDNEMYGEKNPTKNKQIPVTNKPLAHRC